jgi:DinB superfamily
MPTETNFQKCPELKLLDDAYTSAQSDAQALIVNLSEARATWRPHPAAWCVAECLDHLALTNRIYLVSMQPVADAARCDNKLRHRPALPGFLGAFFRPLPRTAPKNESQIP